MTTTEPQYILQHRSSQVEDMELIAVYMKGKRSKNWKDYRFLMRGMDSKREYLLIVSYPAEFIGYRLEFESGFHRESLSKLTLNQFNYYYLDKDPAKLEKVLDEWKVSNPMVHVMGYTHQKLRDIKNYRYTYKFNGKSW